MQDNSASFAFTDTTAGVTFKCSMDGATATTCTSPTSYVGLSVGSHTFSVVATNGTATSAAATYTWTVQGGSFTIGGSVPNPLSPGVSGSINLTFNNGITTPPVNGNTFTPPAGNSYVAGTTYTLAAAGARAR